MSISLCLQQSDEGCAPLAPLPGSASGVGCWFYIGHSSNVWRFIYVARTSTRNSVHMAFSTVHLLYRLTYVDEIWYGTYILRTITIKFIFYNFAGKNIRNLDFCGTFQASTSQTMKVTTRGQTPWSSASCVSILKHTGSFTFVVSTDTNKASLSSSQ